MSNKNISSNFQSNIAIKDFTYWAADDIFDVSGNSFSSEMRYVQMDFKKCKDSPSCQSDSTINSMLKNGQVYLNFKMNYFDFDDYLNPIKQVIDDRYMFRVIPGFQKIIYFYLQNNNVELRDGIVQINEVESHSFYSIGDVDQDFDTEESDGVILSIRIIQDDDVNNYERKVYSLLDMFGQIGGVYEIIRLIFEVLVGFFAKRIMMYTLFSYIYYVEDKNIKSVSANSELNQQVVYPKETLSKVNHQIFTQANNMKITKLNSVTKTKFHELESIQTPEISDRYENSDTFWRNVREKLKHRTHFNYTVKDYF